MTNPVNVQDIIAPVLGVVERAPPANQTEIGPGYRFCRHGQVQLAMEGRAVSCVTCGKTLDAFDVLLEYAQREREWRYFEKQISEAHERLEKLKSEERKTKARLKHASRKEANAAVAAERATQERASLEIVEWVRDIRQKCASIERLALRRRGK